MNKTQPEQKEPALLVIGNGLSARHLDHVQLPSSVITVRHNRVQGPGRTDCVVVTHPHYLAQLPPEFPAEQVYISDQLDTTRPYNRLRTPRADTPLAINTLLAQWGVKICASIGHDSINLGIGDKLIYDDLRLKDRPAGVIAQERWRQQIVRARIQTGVIWIPITTPRQLAQWLQAIC